MSTTLRRLRGALSPRAALADTAGRLLAATAVVHLLNDACFAILYPLLPRIAADLHLSYAQVGALKAVFSGASSLLQLPAGMVGAAFGDYLVLVLGNLWVGLGVASFALARSYLLLLTLAALAGLGGNTQHPLANALVSQATPPARVATALGTLNFAGDLGKFAGPLVAGIVAVRFGWRPAMLVVGLAAAAGSLALLLTRGQIEENNLPSPAAAGEEAAAAAAPRRGFGYLLLAGSLDNSTRGAALTFLPFVFALKGLSEPAISLAFGLIFASGAAGKFVCGWLTGRWGALAVIVATEAMTALALLGFLAAPKLLQLPLALGFGFALNGTSSAFAVSVTRFIPAERRAHGYGLYFTAVLISSALAPLLYGRLGDAAGLTPAFGLMAALTLGVILAAIPVRQVLPAAT